MSRRRSAVAGRRPPRLVLRFTLFTALGLAMATVGIFFLVRSFTLSQAHDAVEHHTQFVAEVVLARQLRPADFSGPVSGERRRELDRLFEDQVLVDDILRGTLYSPRGSVTYSTDPALRGVSTAESRGVRAALAGKEIVTTIGPGVIGDETVSSRVIKQYVPIWFGDRPTGVFVTSRDYAPIAATARSAFYPIAIVLEVLLVTLFVALFPVLRRATRQIASHVEVIEHQALHDSLTGLPNRRLFGDRVAQTLADARRTGRKVGVFLLDLDHFKEVNDTLGHRSGDLLLEELGRRLSRFVRDSDSVARLGGDEFGMVVPVADALELRGVATRIHEAFEPPFSIQGLSLHVGASIGAAVFPDHGADVETLVRHADAAMYTAKRNRTGFEFFEQEDDEGARERLALAGELRQALADGDLVLHYQPKFRLRSHEIVGAEALVRWQHPDRGLLPSGDFIRLVEQSGLMPALTAYVLRLAVEQASAWRHAGLDLPVAVNVDMHALLHLDFPDEVEALLDEHALPADRLVLEITETSIMADPNRVETVAAALARIGVRLSIDDFGTGYSSLSHLTTLPLTELKIDGSFVQRADTHTTDRTVVRAIVDLAHSLGLRVVAEGIETPQTLAVLEDLGCELGQGFLLARPMPPEDLEELAGENPLPRLAAAG